MKTISTTGAAERCDELLEVLPGWSDHLEACRDFYRATGNHRERENNLDAVLRAAGTDTLPRGPESPDGTSRRRKLKGKHEIVLPGVSAPVSAPAWLHFEATTFPPSYSLVEVTMPDRAIRSVEIAGTWVRPTGPPIATVGCFGDPAKVDEWIQKQRGQHATAKSAADVWEYYRSCAIEAGPTAERAVRPPARGRVPARNRRATGLEALEESTTAVDAGDAKTQAPDDSDGGGGDTE